MTRVLVFLLAAALATPAMAAPITYVGLLTGPNEEPANASPGTGTALVTVDDVLHLLRVVVDFNGLFGTTTAAHIHVINGPGDLNTADTLGPVATTTPSFLGFPLGVTSGSMDQTYDLTLASSFRGGFITDAGGIQQAESALISALAEGRAYLNIHTNVFGGGEIRDFLAPEPAVPEPGGLLLLGMAGIGWYARSGR